MLMDTLKSNQILVFDRVKTYFEKFQMKMATDNKSDVLDTILYYVYLHNSFLYFEDNSNDDGGTDAVNEGFAFLEESNHNGFTASIFREKPVQEFLQSQIPELKNPDDNPLLRVQI